MQSRRLQFDSWVWKFPWRRDRFTHPSTLGLPRWLLWWRIHLQFGRPGFDPWIGKIPWRRERLPTLVFWPGEFYELCSSWLTKGQTRLSDFHHLCKEGWVIINKLSTHLPFSGLHKTKSLNPLDFRICIKSNSLEIWVALCQMIYYWWVVTSCILSN